jgi:hypothetical protein
MRESMEICPITAMERAMKLQEVLLRATSGKIKWWQAAELIGISARQLRRRRKRYEEEGYQGLLDRRRKPSSRRVAKRQAEEVLSLYRDRYFDLNVRHFYEKLGEETLKLMDRRTSHRPLQRGRKAPDAAEQKTNQGRGKDVRGKVPFPPNLQIPYTTRDSHFPTASTATNS